MTWLRSFPDLVRVDSGEAALDRLLQSFL